MKKLALLPMLLLAGAPAFSQTAYQTGIGPTDVNPEPMKPLFWNGSSFVAASNSNPLPVASSTGASSGNPTFTADPNNASYAFGDSATTATGTFSAAGTAAVTRGVSISCPTGTSETVTLTNAAGRTWLDYVTGPKNYDGVQAVSWSGNSSACTVTAFY